MTRFWERFGLFREELRTRVRQGRNVEILSYSSSRMIAILLFTIILVVGAFSFQDYGFNSDDTPGYVRAVNLYKFLVSDLPLSERLKEYKMSTYGAMPDLLAYLLQMEFPSLSYESRLLVSWIFGVVGIYYTYRLADVFIGRLCGILSAGILAVNPMWYGYMFINIKDIPFASLLMAALYYCLMALSGKENSKTLYLKIALAVGMLSVTKLIGVVVLGFFVFVHMILIFSHPHIHRIIEKTLLLRIGIAGLAASAGILVFLLIFMPQIYTLDMRLILSSIVRYANFESWTGPLLLNGELYRVGQYPRSYMLVYMAISMPLLILGLALASLPLQFFAPHRVVISAIVIVASFLLYQAVTNARVYNGYRHFLFLLPFIAIMAGYTLAILMTARMSSAARWVGALLIAAGLADILKANFSLHPYQYTYYNELVGGLSGAAGRFDIDTRRTAAREAHAVLNKMAQSQNLKFSVFSCSDQFNFSGFENLRRTKNMEDADFFVATTRICPLEKIKSYKMVDSIERDGVVLSGIYLNEARTPGQM